GPVPAVGFRIDYKGYSIVYSGDTSSITDNMIELSRDADLLIYDTAITNDLPLNSLFHLLHTSPTRIGQVAAEANAGKLLLSHITPVTESRMDIVIRSIRDEGYNGKIKIAKDLKVFNLDNH
ncbi:MAG: MBL fold metallo-hydrolase, partial [Gammaproteobacteria bacterium]|nr:MBL fold metallo-hydrolase [Gammaproteobacteria bacterium]